MAGRTARLGTTQRGWHGSPLEANPYSDAFSLDAARAHGKAQIDAHAALVAKTGDLGADLSVTGEAIEGLHYVLTYLDDPSIFATELVDEYVGLTDGDFFKVGELVSIVKNGLNATFLPPAEKAARWAEISRLITSRGLPSA